MFKAEVLERENLFLPAGFDTPNLISELVKGPQILGSNGEPLLYEEVVRQPQLNTATNRLLGRQQNLLIECQDWNQLLFQHT
jgi:hypothetical protein